MRKRSGERGCKVGGEIYSTRGESRNVREEERGRRGKEETEEDGEGGRG